MSKILSSDLGTGLYEIKCSKAETEELYLLVQKYEKLRERFKNKFNYLINKILSGPMTDIAFPTYWTKSELETFLDMFKQTKDHSAKALAIKEAIEYALNGGTYDDNDH